jgi:DNA-binding transcriptional ArsR family regulator
MTTPKLENFLHPVRLQIVRHLLRRELTAQQLAARMRDVPQATLYRHLKAMLEANYLRVVSERQVRSVMEKVYTLNEEAVTLGFEEAAALPPDEHRKIFSVFTSSILGLFESYIGSGDVDFRRDHVTYFLSPLNLTSEEADDLWKRLQEAFAPFMNLPATPERNRHMLNMAFLPDRDREDSAP